MSLKELTRQQEEIVNDAENNLIAVTALAGTGKTSTLKEFAEKRSNCPTLYLTFNRSMAIEAKAKFSQLANVNVHTFHSLAFAYVGSRRTIITDFWPKHVFEHMHPLHKNSYPAARALILAMNAFFSSGVSFELFCPQYFTLNKKDIESIGYGYSNFESDMNKFWHACQHHAYPITHNGYLKIYQLMQPALNNDFILVDEAQDLSDCILELILGLNGKKIFVGDPFQQIYAWNGAINALTKVQSAGAKTYSLTASFRVRPDLAAQANHYLQILSDDNVHYHGAGMGSDRDDWAIIARTNAGLFKFAAALPNETKIHFLGGSQGYGIEYLEDLGYLMAGRKEMIKNSLVAKFGSLLELQQHAVRTGNGFIEAKVDFALQFEGGLVEACRKIRSQTVEHVDAADLVLTTIHKSKGREFGRVVLLDDFIKLREIIYDPRISKRTKEVKREELHLVYVGLTRAIQSAHYPEIFHLSSKDVQEFKRIQSTRKVSLV